MTTLNEYAARMAAALPLPTELRADAVLRLLPRMEFDIEQAISVE